MAKVEPVEVVGVHTILEGPHWDIERQSLYFNDIKERRIFRYDYGENKSYEASIDGCDGNIGFIVPIEGKVDEFIVGIGPKLVVVRWDGCNPTANIVRNYVEVEQELGFTRFNDGKVDPRGRIFTGTMCREGTDLPLRVRHGKFYCIEKGVPVVKLTDINISNGLTWNEKKNKFYYIDSGNFHLKEFDYDPVTGNISNEVVMLQIEEGQYLMDGMTIDDAGFVYIATFRGGRVIKVNPEKQEIVDEIEIPDAAQITSVAFGGPNLDELFVTTANFATSPRPNGRLFRVTGLGAKGTKMYSAKLDSE